VKGDAAARDYMSSSLVVLSPDDDAVRAMKVLVDHGISGAPVVDAHGSLVGLLTERDCMRVAYEATYHQQPAGKVRDYMAREVETVSADLSVVAVIDRFVKSRFRRFPVVEGSRLVGQLSRRDILRAVLELW
jgi:CBS domain-containing protein